MPAISRAASCVLLAVVIASCSRADTAAPVASVTVTPAHTEIASEGFLDVQYRFEVLPGAVMTPGQRVFVHLVTADGTRVWSDDHDPVPPTAEWKFGQPIEYSRASFLPRLEVMPGTPLTLLVGLYLDAERAPLQAAAEGQARAYPVATLQVASDEKSTALVYTGGWHPDEFHPDGSASWKWTQQAATVSFKNPRRDATFYLEFDGRPDMFPGTPQIVTVSTPTAVLATLHADSSATPVLHRIAVPGAALGTGEMAEIKIAVDKTFVPAQSPAGGKDTRQLGIRVYHAALDGR